ncbi:sugar ABC transporter substrate-binding protein [Clostridium gasigenes]|uniref:sugar ABC transporter substrate-binding protein n=1 Tax=Clostridium gasigenes TaxID=94869 RepID=UPI001C0DB772|nr:substrate-binding domain-containing protein [Clostridium gasigenes]MBU3103963.1 substrate-binding domain-containing protein [Clostridium gasigenes]
MYLSIPNVFLVPVYYAEEDILNMKKIVILQECNFDSDFTNKTVKRKEVVIGLSLPTQREERWVRDKEVIEEYAKNKGVTVKVENADYDAAKQASQVENLISQGIDVLILVPIDPLAAADMVEKAHKAGIKVISYDGIVKNSDLDLYMAFDKIKVGELQGKFLIEKVPKGNYIIISGDPDGMFKEGAMKYIKPLAAKKDINIVADSAVKNWDPNIAFKIVEDALIANENKIDAILAPNDAIAGAAIQALQAQGLAGKVAVTGQDAELAAARRIIQRTQLMTVFKDTRELGKAAIDAAIKLANGEEVEVTSKVNNGKIDVPSILITPIAIDKNNINSVLIDSGYLKQNEVYKI